MQLRRFEFKRNTVNKIWFSARDQFVEKHGWAVWEKYNDEFKSIAFCMRSKFERKILIDAKLLKTKIIDK